MKSSEVTVDTIYRSPTGRLCVLQKPKTSGLGNVAHVFNYIDRNGKPCTESGFAIQKDHQTFYEALRKA